MSDPLWPPGTAAPQVPLSSSISQLAQIHVHLTQWCYLTMSSSAPTPRPAFSFGLSLSQHQGLFQWVGFSHQVAIAVSFSISPSSDIQGLFPSGLTGLICLQSKELSRVFSRITYIKIAFQYTSVKNKIMTIIIRLERKSSEIKQKTNKQTKKQVQIFRERG